MADGFYDRKNGAVILQTEWCSYDQIKELLVYLRDLGLRCASRRFYGGGWRIRFSFKARFMRKMFEMVEPHFLSSHMYRLGPRPPEASEKEEKEQGRLSFGKDVPLRVFLCPLAQVPVKGFHKPHNQSRQKLAEDNESQQPSGQNPLDTLEQ
ncbi:hypothetical protein HK097_001570 [Rhizophlyctis rosea]|uniref:Homing endonuclease LAGLIDADG domain-containing protein n=1 Tax=Rhizophlyctis rosea TaxID=64517 RepID=A0AAD5X1S9_9FUNG|nr:hypothetical protein HK097_001570 [Rhizophlyctis rosea]